MTILYLDECVSAATQELEAREFPTPEVLFFLAQEAGTLAEELRDSERLQLSELPSVPATWNDAQLVAGRIGQCSAWVISDQVGDPQAADADAPHWARAFPVWLAAAYGASICVHTSAGIRLDPHSELEPGTLAVLSDHINMSGSSPLIGVGETRLGPLFPDLTYLYHDGLRHVALERAKSQGIKLNPTIAACTLGPALATPAELAFLAQTGAGVAVQGLADPLLACAHAGLALLSLVAVIDERDEAGGPARIEQIVAHADRCAPQLDDLLHSLIPDLKTVAGEYAEEL